MATTINRVLKRSFRALGLNVSRVPRGTAAVLRRNSVDELHMTAILASILRRDSCGVDVGAHSGSVTETLVRVAPDGHHLAFEPLPAGWTADVLFVRFYFSGKRQ